MSDELGPLRYNDNQEEVFLGHAVTQTKNVSEATAKVIDEEIRRIVDEADVECRKIITNNVDQLHAIANGLLEYETLTGDEVRALMRGESIIRPSNDEDGDDSRSSVRSSVPSSGAVNPEPEPQPGS